MVTVVKSKPKPVKRTPSPKRRVPAPIQKRVRTAPKALVAILPIGRETVAGQIYAAIGFLFILGMLAILGAGVARWTDWGATRLMAGIDYCAQGTPAEQARICESAGCLSRVTEALPDYYRRCYPDGLKS